MQTFLPYDDFNFCARVLDYRRLGKQRVECKQILMALTGQSKGWTNHPATRMWRGHEFSLAQYARCMCIQWKLRGYKDTLLPWFEDFMDTRRVASMIAPEHVSFRRPKWLDDYSTFNPIAASHRSNLLRKDPDYYRQYKWNVPPTLDYVWPV